MNQVCLVGRLTRDPDVRYTNGGMSIARFSIAVDRRFKKEGQADADFPGVVAFGKTAEFIEKYFKKGMRIGLTGRLQTGSYDREDGAKVYTTDVVAENVEFVESKGSGPANARPEAAAAGPDQQPDADGFLNIPEGIDEELPFV